MPVCHQYPFYGLYFNFFFNVKNLGPFCEWLRTRVDYILLLKIGFVTLDPPRDSDKLCILLQGFVWETYVSDMKIVQKIRSERF